MPDVSRCGANLGRMNDVSKERVTALRSQPRSGVQFAQRHFETGVFAGVAHKKRVNI